jgi:hypothetical protein
MLSQVSHMFNAEEDKRTTTEKRSREGQKKGVKRRTEEMKEKERRAYPSRMMLRAQDRQWLTLSAAAGMTILVSCLRNNFCDCLQY